MAPRELCGNYHTVFAFGLARCAKGRGPAQSIWRPFECLDAYFQQTDTMIPPWARGSPFLHAAPGPGRRPGPDCGGPVTGVCQPRRCCRCCHCCRCCRRRRRRPRRPRSRPQGRRAGLYVPAWRPRAGSPRCTHRKHDPLPPPPQQPNREARRAPRPSAPPHEDGGQLGPSFDRDVFSGARQPAVKAVLRGPWQGQSRLST